MYILHVNYGIEYQLLFLTGHTRPMKNRMPVESRWINLLLSRLFKEAEANLINPHRPANFNTITFMLRKKDAPGWWWWGGLRCAPARLLERQTVSFPCFGYVNRLLTDRASSTRLKYSQHYSLADVFYAQDAILRQYPLKSQPLSWPLGLATTSAYEKLDREGCYGVSLMHEEIPWGSSSRIVF